MRAPRTSSSSRSGFSYGGNPTPRWGVWDMSGLSVAKGKDYVRIELG